jgi:fructose transport system ATP-binding protein
VLIGHNTPHVFEIADSIHIHRLGERHAVIKQKDRSMSGAVVIMTGAADAPAKAS